MSSDGSTKAVGHSYSQTKIDPKAAWKLRPGDHIIYGINHHAIVVQCSRSDHKYVRVIHYTSPKEKAKMTKGVVVENWVDLSKENGDLYRVEYKPEAVFDSDEVILRGQSRRGEDKYNIFCNNCEHFAHWCKMDVCECEQVEATILHTGAKNLMVTGVKAGATQTYKPESPDSDEVIARGPSKFGKDRYILIYSPTTASIPHACARRALVHANRSSQTG